MIQPARFPAHRVGIVGAGLVSEVHLRALRRLGIPVVGIADRELARARSQADRHVVPLAVATLDELLRLARPNVVHVLTPPATHADLAEQALAAGAHCYIEKPLSPTLAEADRIMRAASLAGRSVCVGHCLVQDPLMQRALHLIETGAIGEIVHAAAYYCFDPARIPGFEAKLWYRMLAGGFLEDLAGHPASLLVRLLGPVRAASRAPGAPDGQSVLGSVHAERGTGSLFVSLSARPEDVRLEVLGTRGQLQVDFTTLALLMQRDSRIPRKVAHGVRNLNRARQLVHETTASTARFAAGRLDGTRGIQPLIRAFHESLAAGAPPPVSVAEGRAVVEMLRAIWPESVAPPRRVGQIRSPASGRVALVTGATGFVGRHLVARLVAEGLHVRALVRGASRAAAIAGPNVDVIVGNLGDPETIAGLAEGTEVVFHLASIMRGRWEDFEQIDVAGTQALLEEARRAGTRRFVFTSTMSVYRLADGPPITEAMIQAPEQVGPYARAKLRIEALLMEAHRAGGIEAVVTRPGLVFGPGSSPYLTHLPHLGTLRGNRYIVFGDGAVPLQLTYVENTIDALWRAASVPAAAGETFTLIDDEIPTQREYVRHLGELTGRPLRLVCIPRPVAWAVGLGVEIGSAALRHPAPTDRRRLVGKTAKPVFDCSRARQLLGWHPAVGWREGLRRAVGWELGGRGAAAEPRPQERSEGWRPAAGVGAELVQR